MLPTISMVEAHADVSIPSSHISKLYRRSFFHLRRTNFTTTYNHHPIRKLQLTSVVPLPDVIERFRKLCFKKHNTEDKTGRKFNRIYELINSATSSHRELNSIRSESFYLELRKIDSILTYFSADMRKLPQVFIRNVWETEKYGRVL